MRKIIFLIIGLLVMNLNSFSEEWTDSQRKLRSDIKSFLQEEGYVPEIDQDGDIKFKKEGDIYYVKINTKDTSPLFVSFFRVYNYPSEYSPEIVKMACTELNLYKGVKVLCFEKVFYIQAEMYVYNAESFKYAFYKLAEQIASVENNLLDECSKVSFPVGNVKGLPPSLMNKIPFIITGMEVANTDENNKIITDYGKVIYSFNTQYLSLKLKIAPVKTSGSYKVNIRLYKDNTLQTSVSSPNGYTYASEVNIESSSNQISYLTGWGQSRPGFWPSGNYRYEVWLNDLCLGSKSFIIK